MILDVDVFASNAVTIMEWRKPVLTQLYIY